MASGARLWQWYNAMLKRRPVPTQMVTSTVLWGAGDAGAQTVERLQREADQKKGLVHASKEHHKRGLDYKRMALAGVFGFAFVGPIGHFWYLYLDKLAIRYVPTGWKFIATKVSADCLGFAPLHLVGYLSYMGLAEGESWPVVKENVKKDFLPGLAVDLSVWPVIQSVNFAFTPQRHHLMVVNLFSLLDSTFLSWFMHQGEADWKRKVNEFVFGPYRHPGPTTPND